MKLFTPNNMTLGFKTKIDGKATHFVQKIWTSIETQGPADFKKLIEFIESNIALASIDSHNLTRRFFPKIHTIRVDSTDQWKEGIAIHAVTGNRTKNRMQFAPVMRCTGTQLITINSFLKKVIVIEKDVFRELPILDTMMMAVNDGFESEKDFFDYFRKAEGNLKLIHWTDFRY